MDELSLLCLQLEWGADEALGAIPLPRFRLPTVVTPAPKISSAPARAAAGSVGPDAVTAETLDALHEALANFEGCALRATATSTVRPSGNLAARIVMIGEAPGADDDRSGRAFSGSVGQTLDHVLGSVGLGRDQMGLTFLVPWRPPGNRPPREVEMRLCLPFLWRFLDLVRPERIVLLGQSPVRIVLGSTEPLRRLRGRWNDAIVPYQDRPLPAMVLPPVETWLRSGSAKRELWDNLISFIETDSLK